MHASLVHEGEEHLTGHTPAYVYSEKDNQLDAFGPHQQTHQCRRLVNDLMAKAESRLE